MATICLLGCGDDDGSSGNNDNQNNINGNGNGNAWCGNGTREGIEECDDGAQNSDSLPDACRTSCQLASCGDGVVDSGEACDEGPQNSDLTPDVCRASCTLPGCGDGVVDVSLGETCDCGADAGSMPARCTAINGDPNGTCTATCVAIYCGNGHLDTSKGEQCDDGNNAPGDGCGPTCLLEECGNGFVDPGEACDLGTANSTAADAQCRPDCTPRRCGDGTRDPILNEGCDEGENNSDQADATCRTNCQVRRCGDGIKDSGEVCDDGNNLSGDDCSGDCLSEEVCGNGYPDLLLGEQCDDGNAVSKDGCSSGCTAEVPMWSRWRSPLAFDREGHAIAYDAARARLVLFGGRSEREEGEVYLHDTWEHDGRQWIHVQTTAAPPGRAFHHMAWDAARKKVVLHGGRTETTQTVILGDTWEYDGLAWSLATPTVAAPPRQNAMMGYDALRQRVVLFGGADTNWSPTQDTWEYDGVTWQQVFPASPPPARSAGAMTWVPATNRLLLYGGSGGDTGTYEYDGSAWTLLASSASPGARSGHQLVFHPGWQTVLLFDGSGSSIWEWTGSSWWDMSPAEGPPPRSGCAAGFHEESTLLIMAAGKQGGLYDAVYLEDTWAYDGSEWSLTQVGATRFPAARYFHSMTYDSHRGRTLLFGGYDPDWNFLNDTWEFDGQQWFETSPASSPSIRAGAAMAYDSARRLTVLFGGTDYLSNRPLDDTWEYDGETWRVRALLNPPPESEGHSMTFDSARGVTVLLREGDTYEYDGVDWAFRLDSNLPATCGSYDMPLAYDDVRGLVLAFGCAALGEEPDTWEYDGTTWTPHRPVPSPSERVTPGLAFDPVRGRAIVYGGGDGNYTRYRDLWEYDGVTWKEVLPAFLGPARDYAGLVFDTWRRQLVTFGGQPFSQDTWIFEYVSNFPEEVCGDGQDNDGDLLSDCEDLDCRGRPCDHLGRFCEAGACTCPGPAVESSCTNRIDDDCDGLTDCEDPDCQGGTETSCGDGMDNDCDGLTDCEDPDCDGAACANGVCSGGGCCFGNDGVYQGCVHSGGFEDILSTGTRVLNSDDDYARVTLPFTFNLYGRDLTEVTLQTNGGITEAHAYLQGGSWVLPAPVAGSQGLLAVFWTDIMTGPHTDFGVYHETRGTPGSRRFIVQWKATYNFKYEEPGIFQAVLYEGSNTIEFRYHDLYFGNYADFGAESSVGIQSGSAGPFIMFSYKTPSLRDGMTLRFTRL